MAEFVRLRTLVGVGSTGGIESPRARAAAMAGTGGDGGGCRACGRLEDSPSEVGGVWEVRGCCASAEGGRDAGSVE